MFNYKTWKVEPSIGGKSTFHITKNGTELSSSFFTMHSKKLPNDEAALKAYIRKHFEPKKEEQGNEKS